MKRTLITLALLALLAASAASIASAQGELTIESLAGQLQSLTRGLSSHNERADAHEQRLAAIEISMVQQDARLRIIETGAREIAEEMIRADFAYNEMVFESLPADQQEKFIEITASSLVENAQICKISVRELAWSVNFGALFLESQGVTMKSLDFGDGITIHRQLIVTLLPMRLMSTPDQNCDDGIAGGVDAFFEIHQANQ